MYYVVTGAGLAYAAAYAAALVYGWRHRDDPFWRGFIDPFNLLRD